ncbi:MAG: hypothetical protein WAQ57_04390 [Candidatus Saccharimonadales bacterium]
MADIIPFYPAGGEDRDPGEDFDPESIDQIHDGLHRAAESGELERAKRRHPSNGGIYRAVHRDGNGPHLGEGGMEPKAASSWLEKLGAVVIIPGTPGKVNDKDGFPPLA